MSVAENAAFRFPGVQMYRLLIVVFSACLGVALQGCASTDTFGTDPGITVTQETGLPTPDAADVTAAKRPYLVGPFDKLKIDVFGIEELSGREVQTDAAGN